VSRANPSSVADELAIHSLVARYCHAIAERDDDAWANTWATDAEWTVLGQTLNGRDAILAHYRSIVAGFHWVVQVTTNGLIEVEGDEASGRWLVTETLQSNDGRPGLNVGRYRDRYRRDADGAWRFARREFQSSYFGAPDLTAAPRPLGK
jgi:uncharacterized protein (TIGR02246 family)